MSDARSLAALQRKYEHLRPLMTERLRRHWAACEALALGRGGIATVAAATGMSRTTIWTGIKEVQAGTRDAEQEPSLERVRKPGAGRPRLTEKYPTLVADLMALFEPRGRGTASSPLRWTCQSTRQLAESLQQKGHQVSDRSIAALLHELDYRLQANRFGRGGGRDADRKAQFIHLTDQVLAFQRHGQPVVAVDIRKKDALEAPRNSEATGCLDEAFAEGPFSMALGKDVEEASPGLSRKEGWVSIGVDRDTALLATETIRRWWWELGASAFPKARELLVAADAGHPKKRHAVLWQLALQHLADDLGLAIAVCHWPSGISKWATIQERVTCRLVQDRPGEPAYSRAVLVDSIGQPTTRSVSSGRVAWNLQAGKFKLRVPEDDLAAVNLRHDAFRGEWNYTIAPR